MLSSTITPAFQLVQPDERGWDDYVNRHPRGTIFHTLAMIRSFSESRKLTPFTMAAKDESGAIVALLASCQVKSLYGLHALSSRAVQYAEPLCDNTPAGMAGLNRLIQLHDDAMRSKTLMSEIRLNFAPGSEQQPLLNQGYQLRDYVNFVVSLSTDPEVCWRRLNKSMRQKIRATFKRGVQLRDDNSLQGIGRFYELVKHSYHRSQIPLVGRELFEAVFRHLPEECFRLRTAFFEGEPVASVLSLLYRNRIFSWYGGTLRIRGLSPFACIVWDDIQWACQAGYRLYDFGGAGWPNEPYGPRRFKASFGGTEIRYGRYVQTYSRMRLGIAEMAFRMSRCLGCWAN